MYLLYTDYRKSIEKSNLLQIISNDDTIRVNAEYVAQERIKGLLIQKYDIVSELKDSTTYDNTLSYKANYLVQLDAAAYDTLHTYAIGDLVTSVGIVYKSLTAANTGHIPATNPTNWKPLGNQYQLLFSIYPESLFELEKYYKIGNKVFWKDKVYTCQREIAFVFPDDANEGTLYWGTGIVYNVPADKIGASDQSTYWMRGDNRATDIVLACIEITLYHLHKRIAPNNIPDIRVKAFDDTITWLKDCASGLETINIPMIQSYHKKTRIRAGGERKNYNHY